MSKPQPPCAPDCPKRSSTCHDRTVCPDWGIYEDELASWHRMIKRAKRQEDDFNVARRTEQAKVIWRKNQCS